MEPELRIDWLGRVPYAEALELQREAVETRRRGAGPDRLLLLEHPPVVTLGRRGDEAHLLVPPAELARRGIELHRVSRGGDVTYHGPGQLVGYAIVDLEARGRPDLLAFLRTLEAALVDALARLGVEAGRLDGWTGVFIPRTRPPRKIASIGIGARGWVTHHGFALNLDLDLRGFAAIVPCGLRQVEMTSVARELGARTPPDLGTRAREWVGAALAARLAELAPAGPAVYTARPCRAR